MKQFIPLGAGFLIAPTLLLLMGIKPARETLILAVVGAVLILVAVISGIVKRK